jgi:hypothetical protein
MGMDCWPNENDGGKQVLESNTLLVSFDFFGGGFNNRHMKAVRWSTVCTGRLYPQERLQVLISVKRLSRLQGHSAAGRILLINNANDKNGNRTCDLPACSATPQPTTPHRAPLVQTHHTHKWTLIHYRNNETGFQIQITNSSAAGTYRR